MATQTANLGLALPSYEDAADIRILNQNFEKLDESSARWGLEVTASLTPSGALELTGGLPADKDGLTVQFVSPAAATDGMQVKFAGSDTLYPILTTGEGKEPIQAGAWDRGVPVTLTVSGGSCFFKVGAGVNDTLPPQVTGFKAVDSSGGGVPKITVSWQNPTAFFAGILIVRKEGSAPTGVRDGVKVYTGTGTSYVDADVVFDTTYYYRAYPYNQKKQYQTLTNVVSITPKSWQMPKFTGSGYASGNQEKGMFTCLSSGTLTLFEGTYDFFLVGGGAAGCQGSSVSGTKRHGGGGGGGYTSTRKSVKVNTGNYSVQVGAGGEGRTPDDNNPSNPGGETKIVLSTITINALGGKPVPLGGAGGAGGSGGGGAGKPNDDGGGGGDGGCDGSNGKTGYNSSQAPGGKGQGTTTRAFGESNQTLYSGGGGGSSWDEYTAGAGGCGIGGNGAGPQTKPSSSKQQATDGDTNTGSGGGGSEVYSYSPKPTRTGSGGSGIVIIRWGY